MKISLNLGGGAARGFAHIGVLRLMEEEKIPFDMIIGVSIGAFVGAIYAAQPDVKHLRKTALEFAHSDGMHDTILDNFAELMDPKKSKGILEKVSDAYVKSSLLGKILFTQGILTQAEVDRMMLASIPDVDIRDTKIPFACVAVNLYSGQRVVFEKGSLRETVIASSSLPMVFPPRMIKGAPHVDGGVLDKIGIDTGYELGVDHIIAVDVSNEGLGKSVIKSSIDVLLRTEEIAAVYRRKKQLKQATILIQPITEHIHWADYSMCEALIDVGYQAAKDQLDEIRDKLKLVSPFRKFFTFSKHYHS